MFAATVNYDLAAAEGMKPDRANIIFTLLLAGVIAISIKIVGLLLITGMLIIPAALARNVSNNPIQMALFSTIGGLLSILIGLFLFFGTVFQQVALLYTDVANAAFFTIFYVPMVPIIVFFLFKKNIHWSVWPSVILCVIGGYLLTNFHDTTVRLGDTLVVIGAIFWSLHIIFIGKIIKEFNAPILIGLIQTMIVSVCSIILALLFEDFILKNILDQKIQILYAGILSGGIAFVFQIYAQKNISPAPAAIIFSLEGVFATIAAWIILSQILNLNNILGCSFILVGVLISQLLPEISASKHKQ